MDIWDYYSGTVKPEVAVFYAAELVNSFATFLKLSFSYQSRLALICWLTP
jgi:hypothetical protein